VLLASFSLTAAIAIGWTSPAQAAPKLQITSFTADRTLSRPGPTTVEPSCRRGFGLLGVRFNIIGVNPTPSANPATHPAVALLGMVPKPQGAAVTFQNLRAPGISVTIRGTADCTKITGNARRTTDGRKARAKGGTSVDLSTYIVRNAVAVGVLRRGVYRAQWRL
jgi:hypothetical protein